MSTTTLKPDIQQALQACGLGPLADAARALFDTLGYRSDKRLDLAPNTAAEFQAQFDPESRLNATHALLTDWRAVDFLMQITTDEIGPAVSGQGTLFQNRTVDNTNIQSYLFFAVDLAGSHYTRTQLARATRSINKLFPMPAMVIFRHGASLTIAIIARRMHQRDASRDVLEKVTLIKDIRCADPHRAHVEILADLALPHLVTTFGITNFVELQRAWEKTLDTSELNKKFFREVANWYFWAVQNVTFPAAAGDEPGTRNAVSVIRLITRLIFVWFIKEKGLVPADLFDERAVRPLLKWNDPQQSTFYKAILQNLFFATLNTEMGSARRFRGKNPAGRDAHHGIHNVYRYQDYFVEPDTALGRFASIPFLNGGLFECLDRPAQHVRIDGFSDRTDNPLAVPDWLFFGEPCAIDLNAVFGTANKKYEVRGLLRIFDRYKFTIEENTPIEEEIALDPELLGKVFENLLAAYNPETGATARKQTGSFYTPRPIVDYMVDESLLAYLETALVPPGQNPSGLSAGSDDGSSGTRPEGFALEARLRHLLAYTDAPHDFEADETVRLIAAIDRIKVLDPACGSGAFPMGVLHKLVFLLGKLDPGNAAWQARQIDKAMEIPDAAARDAAVTSIEQVFTDNFNDYGRKLYLIENCIYGVDIQPIAVQIAKLRFFISLIVDQKVDDSRPNRGIRPLPNLETKFVAANTLIGLPRPQQLAFRNPAIEQKERELAEVRRRHFAARTQATKEKYRAEDKRLRADLAELLRQDGWGEQTAAQLAAWDPYDQNAHADFFDAEWMFGVTEGFDVVIGNPPYVRQEQLATLKPALQRQYACYTGTADLYVYFYERGVQLLREGGTLTYISSNKYFRAGYGQKLRGYLADQTRIEQLIDFGDAPVFTAIAYPSIILARRRAPAGNQTRTLTWPIDVPLESFTDRFRERSLLIAQQELIPEGWRLDGGAIQRLLEKLRRSGRLLGEFVDGRVYRGISTGMNEAFVVDNNTRNLLIDEHPSSADLLKPYLRGKDIGRWQIMSQDLWLIFTRRGVNLNQYPAILRHLNQYKAELTPGTPGGRKPGSYQWYEIQDNIAYWHEFEKHKIVSTKVSIRPTFAFDNKGYYLGNTSYLLAGGRDPLFLLGVLNSKVSLCYASAVFVGKQNGWYEVQPAGLEEFAVPSGDNTGKISRLVDQILAIKAQNPTADVSALEAEIDQRVYALYGLTAEEIKIVEGR